MENNMNCDFIKQKLESGAIVIDVRSQPEFANGRLKDSFNIPLEHLQASVGNISKDKEVLLYCRSGSRSQMATNYLNSLGFTAQNIGGINQYIGCLDY